LNKNPEVEDLIGLTDSQALNFLEKEGYNDLPSAKPRNIFSIALSVCREPMFYCW
jgi:Ca2+-transporting ATPase